MENVYAFKSYYGVYNPPTKSIELLYICRSTVENSKLHPRTIVNMDEIHDVLKKHGAVFLETDKLKSIKEQVDMVCKAKIIIHEFGSAKLNTILFANNSHTLVLNKFGQGQCTLDIWEELLKRTNCSWEFFENKLPNYNTVFIDSVHLDNRITELLESTRSDKNI